MYSLENVGSGESITNWVWFRIHRSRDYGMRREDQDEEMFEPENVVKVKEKESILEYT